MVKELSQCSFAPATFDKRFVRSMNERGRKYEISEKQLITLAKLHYRYRGQIAALQRERERSGR
jgi:hypothetical protein